MRRFFAWLVGPSIAAAGLVPTSASATCSVAKLLELPVTMSGTRPLVPVTLDGRAMRMLVDSGAFYSNLSPGVAAELKLRLTPIQGLRVGGIGGSVEASVTTVRAVNLAGVDVRNIEFVIGGSEVTGAAGLLGQNVLGIGDVEYDLAHGIVRLMRPHDCRNVNFAYWAAGAPVSVIDILPRDQYQRHTVGTVTVNGVKMRAVFDTGASGTVMSLAAAARIGIRPGGPGVRADGFSRGLGNRIVPEYLIPIESIRFGDQEEIRNTHLHAEANDGADWDLLIGSDFFRSHRVYVANGPHKLFFTYDGGPIFTSRPTTLVDAGGKPVVLAADAEAEPTDAAGYSRRGAAFMARRDLAHALADYDRAVAMAPGDAGFVLQRAVARQQNRQPLLALDDLDRALTLDPANADARLMRASIRLARREPALAEEDMASVDQAAAPAADTRLTLGRMYGELDRFDRAIGEYDLWLRYHPDDSRKPEALNGRCRVRAEAGQDLAKALSDCDAAIRARPGVASFLDSRGLVRLRMGDDAKAIRDYDAALAIAPRSAWSLYGRGLARRHAGDAAGGQRDLDAATALNPALPARARKLGVS